jgi:Domain of unknown function (DUF4386)
MGHGTNDLESRRRREQVTPILATKLYLPPLRPNVVSRSRLLERLNEGMHRKLTLIAAPAGFGKTTLVSAWVAGCDRQVAWLSLDAGENDPTLFLYGPVKGANYILGPGPDTAVIVGGILEIIVALAGIGTAVALFPVLKRQNEGVALGFVGSRTLEAATIFAGVACLLSVVTLRQDGAGAAGLVSAQTLAALYNRSGPARRFRPRRVVQSLGTNVRGVGARRTPDRNMGVFAGRLLLRQRLQALSDPLQLLR